MINHKLRMAQVKNFDGIEYGTITPTDIDGFIDFGNKLFVFIELKFMDTPLPDGQKLAFERLVDSSKVMAIGIVATHAYQVTEDIDVANCLVSSYRTGGKWREPKGDTKLRELIDALVKKFLPEKYEI